jgi:hypothetical protein
MLEFLSCKIPPIGYEQPMEHRLIEEANLGNNFNDLNDPDMDLINMSLMIKNPNNQSEEDISLPIGQTILTKSVLDVKLKEIAENQPELTENKNPFEDP